MPASIKKSRTTDKTIVVLNGRIKVGEVIDGKIKITGGPSAADKHHIEKLARKEGMEIIYPHGGVRPGSGRPKKEPTKTLSYRVPESKAKSLDQKIRKVIENETDNKRAGG